MTAATHSAARALLRDSEHHRSTRAKMQAEHPPKLTYMKSAEGEYTVPEILYPDGMPATIIRDDRRRTWYAQRDTDRDRKRAHYTRAAAAHAEYQRARDQHRRLEELQLTARKIRSIIEDWAQSRTEWRHAANAHNQAIRSNAPMREQIELGGIASYWQDVAHEEEKRVVELIELAGVHQDRIQRLCKLAEARYVQQHYPENYKQIENQAAPWRGAA